MARAITETTALCVFPAFPLPDDGRGEDIHAASVYGNQGGAKDSQWGVWIYPQQWPWQTALLRAEDVADTKSDTPV